MFAFTTVPLPSTIYIPSLSPLVKLVVVPLSLVRVFALASLLVKPWSVTVKDSGEDFDAGDVPAISLSDAHPANTSGRMAAMIILAIFFITVSVFCLYTFCFLIIVIRCRYMEGRLILRFRRRHRAAAGCRPGSRSVRLGK